MDLAQTVAQGIATRGCATVPDAFSPSLVAALRARAQELHAEGAMRHAGVGRGLARATDPAVRGDVVHWLDPAQAAACERELLGSLESVRVAVNQAMLLGLFEFEGHYAIYPPGGGYARHRDRFRDDDARVLSCVTYLNADWRNADGGCLRLYLDDGSSIDVEPRAGTFVAFLSERFEHEVLPATRERCSVAGWFRRRTA